MLSPFAISNNSCVGINPFAEWARVSGAAGSRTGKSVVTPSGIAPSESSARGEETSGGNANAFGAGTFFSGGGTMIEATKRSPHRLQYVLSAKLNDWHWRQRVYDGATIRVPHALQYLLSSTLEVPQCEQLVIFELIPCRASRRCFDETLRNNYTWIRFLLCD